MRLLRPNRQGIAEAVCLLRDARPVGMPTETVYGLAADATNPRAVANVFAAKSRPLFDPLIVHLEVSDPLEATKDVAELGTFNRAARERYVNLARRFWPGPLTFVLPRAPNVPDLVTGGLDSVAIRMPDHPVAQALLAEFHGPLVAPSANRFGRISPTEASHVVAELGDVVPAVIDGGPCRVGVESTIVRIDPDGAVGFLRPGGIPIAAVEDVVGSVVDARPHGLQGPGQTDEHYAPSTRAHRLPHALSAWADEDLRRWLLERGAQDSAVGWLRVMGEPQPIRDRLESMGVEVERVITLSAGGDWDEAAHRLFAALRELDDSEAGLLVLEPRDTREGLGHAIADRLRRAAGGSR